MIRPDSNSEVKKLFIASMKRAYDFSCGDNNPFLMELANEKFFVFLKNIASAHLKNSPDVTRVQLSHNAEYTKIIKANIPFIVLGYDAENDVFVNWNPEEIKRRLNAKKNVSLYSRNSLQKSVKGKLFKEGILGSGGKVIVFKRNLLIDFFKDWAQLYDFEETNTSVRKIKEKITEEEQEKPNKIYEITEEEVIKLISPHLKGSRVLEAATICYKYYASKYKGMKLKDWLNIANDMYSKTIR